MPKCVKCASFFPPDVCYDIEDNKKMCVFCKRDTNEVTVNGVKITRQEIINEYKQFLDELRYRNDLLKDYADGKIDLDSFSNSSKLIH